MKKLFIAFFGILLFASCKKESTNIVEQVPVFDKNVKTVSSVYSDGSTDLYTYSFDPQGRLTSSKQEHPGFVRIITFDYATAGKVFVTKKDNDVIIVTYEGDINEKGFITKIVIKYANGNLYVTYNYTYNADGYMIKTEWTYPNGNTDRADYIIENGNVMESKSFSNGVFTSSLKYTYDFTKYNSEKYGIGGLWRGISFGKPSKNLTSNLKQTNAGGNVTWNVNNTYQLDAAGYLEKVYSNNLIDNSSWVDTYTH